MNRLLIKIWEYNWEESEEITEFIDLHYHWNKELSNELMKHLLNATNQFFSDLNNPQ